MRGCEKGRGTKRTSHSLLDSPRSPLDCALTRSFLNSTLRTDGTGGLPAALAVCAGHYRALAVIQGIWALTFTALALAAGAIMLSASNTTLAVRACLTRSPARIAGHIFRFRGSAPVCTSTMCCVSLAALFKRLGCAAPVSRARWRGGKGTPYEALPHEGGAPATAASGRDLPALRDPMGGLGALAEADGDSDTGGASSEASTRGRGGGGGGAGGARSSRGGSEADAADASLDSGGLRGSRRGGRGRGSTSATPDAAAEGAEAAGADGGGSPRRSRAQTAGTTGDGGRRRPLRASRRSVAAAPASPKGWLWRLCAPPSPDGDGDADAAPGEGGGTPAAALTPASRGSVAGALFFLGLCQASAFAVAFAWTATLVRMGRFCSGGSGGTSGGVSAWVSGPPDLPAGGGIQAGAPPPLLTSYVPGCALGSAWFDADLEGGVLWGVWLTTVAQASGGM